jgi:hypothetical protein
MNNDLTGYNYPGKLKKDGDWYWDDIGEDEIIK